MSYEPRKLLSEEDRREAKRKARQHAGRFIDELINRVNDESLAGVTFRLVMPDHPEYGYKGTGDKEEE